MSNVVHIGSYQLHRLTIAAEAVKAVKQEALTAECNNDLTALREILSRLQVLEVELCKEAQAYLDHLMYIEDDIYVA